MPDESVVKVPIDVAANSQIWRNFIGLATDDGIILDAGPITKRDFDFTNGQYTITGAGMRAYFEARYVLNNKATWTTDSVTLIGSKPYLTREFLRKALEDWTKTPPIVLSNITQTFPPEAWRYGGSDMKTVDDLLSTLQQTTGGLDVTFIPRFQSGTKNMVEWVAMFGDISDGILTPSGSRDPVGIFDMQVPSSPIKQLSVSEDGSDMGTYFYATGGTPDGADSPTPSSRTTNTLTSDSKFPTLQRYLTFDSVTDGTKVQQMTNEAAAKGALPTDTWALTAVPYPKGVLEDGTFVDSGPQLGSYREGDFILVRLPVNPFTTLKQVRLRILSYTAGGDDVSFTTSVER